MKQWIAIIIIETAIIGGMGAIWLKLDEILQVLS